MCDHRHPGGLESPGDVPEHSQRGSGKPMDSAQSMAKGARPIQHDYGSVSLMVYDRSKLEDHPQILKGVYGSENFSKGGQCEVNNYVDDRENEMANAGLTPLRQPIGAIPDFPVMLEHKPTVSVMSLSQRMAFLQ